MKKKKREFELKIDGCLVIIVIAMICITLILIFA